MLSIFKHLRKKEWALVLVSIVFVYAQVWLDLKLPDYMREITALLQTSTDSITEIWRTGVQDAAMRAGQPGYGGDGGLFCGTYCRQRILSDTRGFVRKGRGIFHGGDQPVFHLQPHHPLHQ